MVRVVSSVTSASPFASTNRAVSRAQPSLAGVKERPCAVAIKLNVMVRKGGIFRKMEGKVLIMAIFLFQSRGGFYQLHKGGEGTSANQPSGFQVVFCRDNQSGADEGDFKTHAKVN